MRPQADRPKGRKDKGLHQEAEPVSHPFPTDTRQTDPDLARVVDAPTGIDRGPSRPPLLLGLTRLTEAGRPRSVTR
jgi:hypothetical protein